MKRLTSIVLLICFALLVERATSITKEKYVSIINRNDYQSDVEHQTAEQLAHVNSLLKSEIMFEQYEK